MFFFLVRRIAICGITVNTLILKGHGKRKMVVTLFNDGKVRKKK